MFGTPINNGLTITKVLGGLSKTLSIANQVIPLYKEAKPMLNNARNILSVLKDLNKGNQNTPKSTTQYNNIKEKDTYKEPKRINNSNPSFFL